MKKKSRKLEKYFKFVSKLHDHSRDEKDIILVSKLLIFLLGVSSETLLGVSSETYQETLKLVQTKLAFIYCQQGQNLKAKRIIEELGCKIRLSRKILNYRITEQKFTQGLLKDPSNKSPKNAPLKVVDNFLTNPSLSFLSNFFSPTGPYFTSESYSSCSPYFSHLYNLCSNPSNPLEQIILTMTKLVKISFPSLYSKVKIAEYWAHSRHHPHGHQLHFDSENEGVTTNIRHPLVSAIIYLDDCGGPTLITDMTLKSGEMAQEGWLVRPKRNRCVIFDALYLHGVIPGRGGWNPNNSNGYSKRISFMVGFWDDIKEGTGRAARYPNSNLKGSKKWIQELNRLPMFIDPMTCETTETVTPTALPVLSKLAFDNKNAIDWIGRVWETTDGNKVDKGMGMVAYDDCFQGF